MEEALVGVVPYWLSVCLLVVGLYGVLAKTHLARKLMAMNILQVAVITFFILFAAKRDATPPVALPGDAPLAAATYVNPLPHALMLTAIVVSVSTTGVALAILIRIYRRYGTLDELKLIDKLRG